ncbi:hypothetical protein CN311_02120 [Mesorhizobium sanjuanii]|uniref:DUF1127 domain-containing protein n=2 Tax=Mesorhizobium TaxID=68287 RepID=A0A2A6FLD0_9HYPH|nr:MULTISPECIES: hypothetical protein [Mesorhizobium]PDQ22759.1 hypothetical protein CN311_02120 [Mesorhizobium sanjuanii]PTE10733.1 hypothetical protein C9427_09375 [Mesorhizobium helmanticense]
MTTVQEKLLLTPGHGWFSRLVRGFARHVARKRTYLDIRELPPHLQRDMGFLDGNDPYGPRQ